MSSLIEWPSIYGSSYFLPAVVVAVLLLALLLLMSSHRRRAARIARNAAEPRLVVEIPAPGGTLEPLGATVAASEDDATVMTPLTQPRAEDAAAVAAPEVAAEPASAAMMNPIFPMPVRSDPQPAMEELQPVEQTRGSRRVSRGRDIKVTMQAQEPRGGTTGTDHLNAALLDILGGWGDLSPEDFKRLELFRPERLAAALADIQLPKSKSREAKARLGQLRQYSANLEPRALSTQVPPVAAAQADVVPAPEATAVIAAPSVPAAPALAPDVAPWATSAHFPEGPTDTTAAASAPDSAAESSADTSGAASPSDSRAAASSGASLATTDCTALAIRADAATEASSAAATTTSPHLGLGVDDLTPFWAEPRPLWQLAKESEKEASFDELPAPSFREVELAPEGAAQTASEQAPESNTELSDTPICTLQTARTDAPQADTDYSFWDEGPAGPLSRLSVKVETAEQLLALPPQERVEMTAFLEPAELAATFRATKDPDLKKAVIDTLEHIGSPASLNALGNCFEDNSSDIQLYALQAADRLLGVV